MNKHVTLLTISYKETDSTRKKIAATITFILKGLLFSFTHHECYIRYNPKVPLLILWSLLLSRFKQVFIEHNMMYTPELKYLGRNKELATHKFLYKLLRFGKATHLVVHKSLRSVLQQKGIEPSKVKLLQNGYLAPPKSTHEVNKALVNKVKRLKDRTPYIAIFVGNGAPWHGLTSIIHILKDHPKIHLLVAGPYPLALATTQVTILGSCTHHTLQHIYPLCDVSFGTFNWQLLGINEGCPLKTSEYLSYGVPVIVNYHDWSLENPKLNPYIMHISSGLPFESFIESHRKNHSLISEQARSELSWDTIYSKLLS